MAKKFITLKDAENCIHNGKIYLEEKAILASNLKDYIREKELEIVYGEKPLSSSQEVNQNCSAIEVESLEKIIEKLLRRDFNVQDTNKINQIIRIVREVLN